VSGDALSKTIKPNFRVLGKKVGKQMKAAAAIINQLDADAISALESAGTFTIDLEGTPFELTREDVDIAAQDIPGWSIASDGALTVALDLTLTPALEMEGLARELVNRIQNLRKDAGLEVTDRIAIELSENDKVTAALAAHNDYISSEVLADVITASANVEGTPTDLGSDVGEVMIKVVSV
jgi:isoleucyl-tRNA synthetase